MVLNEDGSVWLSPEVAERVRVALGPVWRAQASRNGGWPRWQLDVLDALDKRVTWADLLENAGLPFDVPNTVPHADVSSGSAGKMVSSQVAARRLGQSPRWVRARAARGDFPGAHRSGRDWAIPEGSLPEREDDAA